MITKDQLNSISFFSDDNTSYYGGNWDFEFNIKTQDLYTINDGFGEPELVCKCTNFKHLKEVLYLLTTEELYSND
jgi:hypothetical protein